MDIQGKTAKNSSNNFEAYDLENHFSIVMKELERLTPQVEMLENLTKEILISLRSTQFLQNDFMLNTLDQDNSFQQAIAALAKKVSS